MQRNTSPLCAPAPRKAVMLGIMWRIVIAATSGLRPRTRSTRQQAEKDLAQRVREVGEW
ncbi:hypothetical protein [Ramlibacter sp. AN1133]|uniref:hypothetical protein n=1 Tax=Ramlibacter sp. AN1133 TaxID=3133429 RepID=UPI0030BC2DE8